MLLLQLLPLLVSMPYNVPCNFCLNFSNCSICSLGESWGLQCSYALSHSMVLSVSIWHWLQQNCIQPLTMPELNWL